MQKMAHIVRKYPLSLLCLALIALLSFTPFFPETPLDDVAFIDKWTHLVMYGGTTSVIWWEYLRNHQHLNLRRLLLWALLAMVILGGVVELLQAYCTTTRSGEWLDFWADSIGVLLGNLLGWLLHHFFYFSVSK
jgi:VanZ family protein